MSSIITDDDLHASLPLATAMRYAGALSHQPQPQSPSSSGSSAAAVGRDGTPGGRVPTHSPGVSRLFNLNACLTQPVPLNFGEGEV